MFYSLNFAFYVIFRVFQLAHLTKMLRFEKRFEIQVYGHPNSNIECTEYIER